MLHAIPHAVGRLDFAPSGSCIVAHQRPDASITPCQLRHRLLQPVLDGVTHLAEAIASLEIIGGAVELGAGLFQTGSASGPGHRWFATTLCAQAVQDIVAHCPAELEDGDVSVRVMPDPEMGVCAIRVSGEPSGPCLDVAAWWLYEQCLVAELLAAAQ